LRLLQRCWKHSLSCRTHTRCLSHLYHEVDQLMMATAHAQCAPAALNGRCGCSAAGFPGAAQPPMHYGVLDLTSASVLSRLTQQTSAWTRACAGLSDSQRNSVPAWTQLERSGEPLVGTPFARSKGFAPSKACSLHPLHDQMQTNVVLSGTMLSLVPS
jgi:hypothetical protein